MVINNAHELTPEASNALLKILEEPPPSSVIILVSSLSRLLLSTVVSRCEEVRFTTPDIKTVLDYLASQKKVSKEDSDFLIRLAGGRIGLIHDLLEEDGLPSAKKAINDLRKLLNSSLYEKLDYARKMHESEKYTATVNYWLGWVSYHLRNSSKNEKILRNLLSLSSIVSQPQFNHRLALENFLIGL